MKTWMERKMEMTFGKVKWKSVNKFVHTIEDKCSLSLSRSNEFLLNYNIFHGLASLGISVGSRFHRANLPRTSA